MNKKILTLITLSSLSFNAAYAGAFTLTEESLVGMAKKSNPSLNEIEATFLTSKVQAEELKDKFGFEAYGGYNHTATKERSTIPFNPVFSSINQYQVGVKKYTKYGVVLDANTTIDSRSGKSASADYKDLTTTTHTFGIQMDLWKDFMGKVTKAQFDNVQDMRKKDELQGEISKNVLVSNVRKVYWSLVANAEKLRITNNLYTAAQRQAKDARKRKASSVSDKAEVARFESLVHQRKGQLLSLEYEREMLFKNLRDLFPGLNGKELKLANYNLNKTVFEVLACTTQINGLKDVPYEHTKYDEITGLLRSMQSRQAKVDGSYDDIDLKLDLKLKQVGVASESPDGTNYQGDYGDSITDMNDNDRGAMVAGVMLTIPFGEDKAGTAAVKEKLTEYQFSANIDKLDANVRSTHKQVKESVKLLSYLIREQSANSKQLSIRVKEMKRKYAQARIPEYALIQDEDSLLQSDLTVVDTQLLVVNTVLDYLSVFNTFPCTFNRK